MTNDGQRADQPEFKVEDEIDLLLGRANPNPTREGCPPRDVLMALARRECPMEDPAYEHLAKCSPCFTEFRAFQQSDVTQRAAVWQRRRIAYAAAAVLAVAIGGSWFALQRTDDSRTAEQATAVAPGQSVTLDLRPFAVNRSAERSREPEVLALPRGRLNVTVLLPVGSEPGEYEIQILDADPQARASAKGTAEIRDYVTTLEVTIDLTALSVGSYRLALRREDADWRFFPAQVR